MHKTGSVTISLPRLDALLRASGLSAGLAACLTAKAGRCTTKQPAAVPARTPATPPAIIYGPKPEPIPP